MTEYLYCTIMVICYHFSHRLKNFSANIYFVLYVMMKDIYSFIYIIKDRILGYIYNIFRNEYQYFCLNPFN